MFWVPPWGFVLKQNRGRYLPYHGDGFAHRYLKPLTTSPPRIQSLMNSPLNAPGVVHQGVILNDVGKRIAGFLKSQCTVDGVIKCEADFDAVQNAFVVDDVDPATISLPPGWAAASFFPVVA